MARREVNDEQRSYSGVFLLAVAFLLIGAVWSVWDDNISRRPWKYYQAEFFEIEQDQLKKELADERTRLEGDAEYVKANEELRAANESLATGETRERIDQLETKLAQVTTAHNDFDLSLRIQKSRLEEAWFLYEDALHHGSDTVPLKQEIDELEAGRVEIQKGFDSTKAEIAQIESELQELRSVATNLDEQLKKMTAERRRLEERLDSIGINLGPWRFPKIPRIEQIVLPEFERSNFDNPLMRVDRCMSCHVGINRDGFEDAPQPYTTHPERKSILGNHDPLKFGCTPCHQGQGPAVNSPDVAHGHVRFWEKPLLEGNEVQASCIGCHANVEYLPHADAIASGEKLFEELGCHGCHLAQGYEDLGRVAPYLRRIRAKVDPSWLIRWVENPHEYRPHTRMPNFMFSQAEAVAIASYLWTSTKDESDAWLADRPQPDGIDASNAEMVAQGQELVDSMGCRGCHGFAEGEAPARLGETKDIAPNLSKITEKTDARWMYYWITGPRGYSPDARMPSLRLTDAEAKAVVSYLLTLGQKQATPELVAKLDDPAEAKKGEALVRKYGCAGCHNITGMENAARIGAELTSFGSKRLSELFFGDRTDIPQTWDDWTYHKLETPRIYQTERIEQVMPNFELSASEIESVRRFLRSQRSEKVPARYRADTTQASQREVQGRRIVARYNCVGCHVIQGKGGAIRDRYEENPNFAPPILNGEGAKVQSDWLYGFLQQPVPLRPWLQVRMPTFGLSDEETTALVEYFAALEDVEQPFVHIDPQAIPVAYLEAAETLVSEDYFSCFSCHQRGAEAPEGPPEGWAPDLGMAHERLRPEWIVRWLRNPQAVQPGTKMPSFYEVAEDGSPEGGPDDVLDGNNLEQIKAIRDYLMVLNEADRLMAKTTADETAPAAVEVIEEEPAAEPETDTASAS